MNERARILVAEDEPNMQILLLHTLRRAGFEVSLARNGVEAKQHLIEERYDLICSDVMMSAMDGMQLCAWTKQQPGLREVPFVLLSSRAQQMDRDAGIDAGADAYMTKPFDVKELIRTVHSLLDGR